MNNAAVPADIPRSPSQDDKDYVAAVVARSGTSFFWAMRLLPPEKQAAMYAIYAFCREVDDIADEPGDETEKREQLGEWRALIRDLFQGQLRHPVTRALAAPLTEFGLAEKDFMDVIDGMEMDAGASLRIADMNELALYCDRVACAVGRLSNRVFGLEPAKGDELAHALGEALQLTNILRDVRDDAERSHVYLPADVLRRHGVDDTDPVKILDQPGLAGVCEEIAALAERRFGEAEIALAACDRQQVRAARIMMVMYRRLFEQMRRRGWRRFDPEPKLSRIDKLWLVFRYGLV
jgi:squalene synthase HpnD